MPTKTTKTKTAVKTARTAKTKSKKEKEELLDNVESPEVSDPSLNPAETEETGAKVEKYYESVGRRKEATARIRVFTKKSSDAQLSEDKALITVNGKPYYEYFVLPELQQVVESPMAKLKSMNRFKATVKVKGGGISGQADAIKFGLSRALTLFDPNFSKKLKKAGFLTRDARVKERRKYGLKKARKSPQWAKR